MADESVMVRLTFLSSDYRFSLQVVEIFDGVGLIFCSVCGLVSGRGANGAEGPSSWYFKVSEPSRQFLVLIILVLSAFTLQMSHLLLLFSFSTSIQKYISVSIELIML